MEMLLTAEPITARRGYELGLVNKIVPAQYLVAETQRLAMNIAANAPLSVRAGKALVYASAEMGWSAALETGDRIYEQVYLSEDGQEGPRAFRDKRKPEWKGR
jgi:enoyl-CoA hydratase/carnithine racemase